MIRKEANPELAKKLNWAAWGISLVVLLLVGLMRRPELKIPTTIDFSFLPPFHASVNALTALALVAALYFIKQKNIVAHQRSIYTALGLSAVFLLSYVVYHFTTDATLYCFEGNIRYVYFFFLITHVVLAGGILPFILLTFIRAYTGQYEKHKKMARWVYPLWLYVAITGPVCYLMLSPCYA
ncbi:MAG: DUF420 domain-containing protein [Bacteroidota bacterium]